MRIMCADTCAHTYIKFVSRRLDDNNVRLLQRHSVNSEDRLVDETMSFLVKYFPEKIVEAAANLQHDP
jgi:hypothetical protein